MPEFGTGQPNWTVPTGRRLADLIAADLRERILNGKMRGRELPKQEELVAHYKVSAPPLREALRILEVEGLITVRRGKLGGAQIHRPDGASAAHAFGMALQGAGVELEDLAASLCDLEPRAAAMCAGESERRGQLMSALEENIRSTEDVLGDGEQFTQISREFHELVVDHVANLTTKFLIRSLVSVWSAQEVNWASQVINQGQYPDSKHQSQVLRAHRRIAAAIGAGDSAGAEQAARRHLEVTQAVVLAQFRHRVVDAASPLAVEVLRRMSSTREE